MDYIISICGDEYKKKSRGECVRRACEFIDGTCFDEWETEVKEITQYAGELHGVNVVCVSMLQESMDTYDIRGKTPYEHLSDLCKGATDENMKILSAPRTKKTMEDVVGGMYDMDERSLRELIEGVLETTTVRDMIHYILANIMNMTAEVVQVDDDDPVHDSSETIDDDNDEEKRELEETIMKSIERLRLSHVTFEVHMNANTKRKGDPHDIVFTYTEGERITGKKSWRSCIKTLAKKEYTIDLEKMDSDPPESEILETLEKSGFTIVGVDDIWVYVVCYIIQESLETCYKQRNMSEMKYAVTKQDVEQLPKRTIDDVIKICSRLDDKQFHDIVRGISIEYYHTMLYPKKIPKTFLRIVYEALWGDVRPRQRTVSDEPGPSTSKQRQKKTDADVHPTQGSQKQKDKTPVKSTSTLGKRGRPRKKDTVEKDKTRKKQTRSSKDDDAAKVLSQLSGDRMGQTIPSEAIIYNGFGCTITIETFVSLAEQLCEMHDISLDDMISYLVSEGFQGPASRYCFIGVYDKLCQCLASTNPVMKKGMVATVNKNGVTTDISVTPMDVISFFAHMLIRERIVNRLMDLKDEVDKKENE